MKETKEIRCYFSNLSEVRSEIFNEYLESYKSQDYLNEYNEGEEFCRKEDFNCTVKFESEVATRKWRPIR
jgi:hypothetical protein